MQFSGAATMKRRHKMDTQQSVRRIHENAPGGKTAVEYRPQKVPET